MKESQAIDALGALSHETRLRIVRHLVTCGRQGNSAGAICEAVDASPSKITFHVSALERAGLVNSERVSRQIVYRVQFNQLGELLNYLMQDCCLGHADVLACCSSFNTNRKC